jgi:NarL family two-component system response regulator YdfI
MSIMPRLLLVEDHILVRQSIRAFLEEAGFVVIGEAGSGVEAIQLIRELHPDVILLDIHLPEMNGIETARQIRQQWADIRIIVLTAYNETAYQRALKAIGIHDFVLKTAEFSELLERIKNVMKMPLNSPPAAVPFDLVENADYRLTEREVEVLRGAAQGWTNKQIGVQLDISARTVQVHLHTIYQKLNVANRTEAVLRALALDMIPAINEETE